MTERFPNYDVLAKRDTLSWNDATRRAIDARLAIPREPRFFDARAWAILNAICARILPQPKDRPAVPIAAYIDDKMFANKIDGYRAAALLPQGEAWKAALAALDEASHAAHGQGFVEIDAPAQDALLVRMQKGELSGPFWRGMPSDMVFSKRVLHDVTNAYYAHPTAWSEIGFGGPASPRGYVRLDANQHDPWEAAEAHPGEAAKAARKNARVV
jgi:hypothetical protein